MTNTNGKMPQPEYDDRDDTRMRSSAIPYRAARYRVDVQEEEYDDAQATIAIPTRRSSAPLMLSGTRQPARTQRNTEEIQQVKTQQIRIEQPEQTKRLLITRRNLFIGAIVGSVAVAGGAMGLSFAGTKYNETMHQYAEGKSPATSLALVCGHNNDSPRNPTWLHAYLTGDIINFVEKPAGDPSKVHIYETQSLREVGYQGSLSNVYIELIPSVVNGAHQVVMRATCEDVAILAEPLVVEWKLIDNGGYFHTEQPK